MAYDFDRVIERRHTESAKWRKYGEGVVPLWVADMDFPSPEPVVRALRDRVELCAGRHDVAGVPEVQRCGQSLVLGLRPRDGGQEFGEPLRPLAGAGGELEAVVADVDELGNADDAARVVSGAAADARDERVPRV